MTIYNELNGMMRIKYENQESQDIYLKAILKRPKLNIKLLNEECDLEEIKLDQEAGEYNNIIDFNKVHLTSPSFKTIYLFKETDVVSDWQINQIKFKKKDLYGYETITQFEKEDFQMFDDETVFNFSVASGQSYGPSLVYIKIPRGPALPNVENKHEEE
jgi:hypothetical protein